MIEPGIYDNLPAEVYHSREWAGVMSSSAAVALMDACPAAFWWNSKMNPDLPDEERTSDMDFGTAAHLAVLEDHLFDCNVVIVDADDWRTKAAQQARDDIRASGLTPLLAAKLPEVKAMVAAVRSHPLAGRAFVGGKAEQTLVWRDRATGVLCKARPDYLRFGPGGKPVSDIDYKTVTSAQPRAFERHAFEMGYHQQRAWYLEGVRACYGIIRLDSLFVAQERKAPYLPAVFRLDNQAIEHGHKLNRRAREIFAECMAHGEWPGYRDASQPDHDRAFLIGLPRYASFQIEDRTAAGEFDPKSLFPTAAAAQAPLGQEI